MTRLSSRLTVSHGANRIKVFYFPIWIIYAHQRKVFLKALSLHREASLIIPANKAHTRLIIAWARLTTVSLYHVFAYQKRNLSFFSTENKISLTIDTVINEILTGSQINTLIKNKTSKHRSGSIDTYYCVTVTIFVLLGSIVSRCLVI